MIKSAEVRPASRCLGELTFQQVRPWVKDTSILCLPLGAIEQHGPHLPLNTDITVAEGLARRILARWGDEFDLWLLPSIPLGLSREHDWAPGTLSLSIEVFVGLLKQMARELVRAFPARNLLLVNGHGGNRGALENLLHELQSDLALNCGAIHPFDLARGATKIPDTDVHGGLAESSVMLVLAPELVHLERLEPGGDPGPEITSVHALIFDRGVSFPWRSSDARLARDGVIGNARAASVEMGQAIIDAVLTQTHAVLQRLLENQKIARSGNPTLPWQEQQDR
jgi:creatinine amidohydrolase/Fe(II)-dependent formamide hydrolase-like protein